MGVPAGGCPVPPFADTVDVQPIWARTQVQETVKGAMPPPPISDVSAEDLSRQFASAYAQSAQFYLPPHLPKANETDLGHGLLRFRVNQRHGVRNIQGDTLVGPVFDYVESADVKNKFIGYGARFANLYDLNNKALLNEKYLHIIEAGNGNFIVQQPTGYGLIDAEEKFLLPAIYPRMASVSGEGQSVVHVQDSPETSFFFAVDDGLKIQLPYRKGFNGLYLNRYLSVYDRAYWVDLQTKRFLNCEEDYQIRILTDSIPRFQLRDKRRNHSYVFRPETGRTLGDITLNMVMRPQPLKPDVAYFRVVRHDTVGDSPLFGLTDGQGKLLVAPTYHLLYELKWPYFAAILKTPAGDHTGVLDALDGSTVIPFKSHELSHLFGSTVISLNDEEEAEGFSTAYDLSNGKKLFRILGSYDFKALDLCGNRYYVGRSRMERQLFNRKGEVVLAGDYRNIRVDTSTTYLLLNGSGSKLSWVDCDFVPVSEPSTSVHKFIGEITPEIRHYRRYDGSQFLTDGQQVIPIPHYAKNPFPLGVPGLYKASPGWPEEVITDRFGEVAVGRFSGGLGNKSFKTGGVAVRTKNGFEDLIIYNGQLLFGGAYEKVKTKEIDLFNVSRGNWSGVGNAAGELVLPLSLSSTEVVGGMIVRDGKAYFRDGTLMAE